MNDDQLAGEALDQRAAELEIPSRTSMSADQKRDAVERVEGGEDPQAVSDDVLGDEAYDEDGGAKGDQQEPDFAGTAVASREENAALEHTEGGATTRDDATDAGVPMLQGSPDEPVGPEDALGQGPKRGDYSGHVPGNPHESVAVDGGGEPVYRYLDKDGRTVDEDDAYRGDGDDRRLRDGYQQVQVDVAPVSELQPQAARTEDRGDAEGQKGGVDTADVRGVA